MQIPRISPHQTPWDGHTVTLDVWYPIPETCSSHPYLSIVDRFSLFMVSGALKDHTPKAVGEFPNERWVAIFGRPVRILPDKGTCFAGDHFPAFASVWGIIHIFHPTDCAYKGGIFERTIGMPKAAITAIRNHDNLVTWSESVTLACIGRNLSPLLESGIPPMAIITGRHSVLKFAIDYHFLPEPDPDTQMMSEHEMNMKRILTARAAVIQFEPNEVIRKCLKQSSPAHSDQVYQKDDIIQLTRCNRWIGGYRFLAMLSHNCLIERGSVIEKVPVCNIRPAPPIDVSSDSRAESSNANRLLSDDGGGRDVSIVSDEDAARSSYHAWWERHDEIDSLSFDWEAVYRCSLDALNIMVQPYVHPFCRNASRLQTLGYQYHSRSAMEDCALGAGDAQTAYDPSRAPPKIYLKCHGPIASIRKELHNITEIATDGIDPSTVVH